MKKLMTICLLIATALTVKAQELENLDGIWKFEKMKIHGYIVYFDGTAKDKENAINGYLKAVKNGLASDEEKEISIKGINENKSAIYASFKEQYGYNIEFKDNKLFYKFFNNDGKMEKTEAKLNIKDDILKLYTTNYLYDIFDFTFLVKDGKLKLTEINEMTKSDDEVFVFYFKK
jgi:hypothetical protein